MSTTTYRDGRRLTSSYLPDENAQAWTLLVPPPNGAVTYYHKHSGVYFAPLWRGDPDGDLIDAMRDATTAGLIPAWARGSAQWRTGPDGAHGADYPDPLDR